MCGCLTCMEPLCCWSGQVGGRPGTTLATIRTLCESHGIASETTPGGHLRVPAAEVERLKKSGVPAIPRRLPTASAPPARTGTANHDDEPEFLALPSDEVALAGDQVAIAKSMLEKRKVDRELEEVQDWFSERAEKKAKREAEQEESERRRQAEVEAKRDQQQWENHWLTYALNCIPFDARGEMETDVHREACGALATTSREAPSYLVQRLVDAAVSKALKPWRRRKEVAHVIERAESQLPSAARGCYQPTAWQVRATQLARAAIEALPDSVELREIEAAAKDAVDQVSEEYRDVELRRSVRESARPWPLWLDLSEAGKQSAQEAIDKALATMPLGTSKSKLEAACKKALEPLEDEVAQRQAQKQDRAIRESVLALAPFRFPWNFAAQDRDPALAAVREALAKLPVGTAHAQIEKARDEGLQPFAAAHKLRERKKELI